MEVSWERSDPSDSVSEGETELETCTHVLQDDDEDEEERNQSKHSDQQSQEFSASGELTRQAPEQECLSANSDKLNYEEKDATPDSKGLW